jgi:uncharacterized membrane protein YfcA
MSFLWLVVAGFVSGVIGGMGMDGGTLLIPILTIFLAFEQKNAQAINLFVFIPMALVSLIIHIKNKLVDFKVGIPIICTGVIFSVLGSILADGIENNVLKKIFGVFLLIVGIDQAISTIINIVKSKRNNGKFKMKIYIK